MIYWEKHDDKKNQHRWYLVSFGQDLFGDLVLTRAWGRVGRRGCQEKHDVLSSNNDLDRSLERITKQRKANGYTLLRRSYTTEIAC